MEDKAKQEALDKLITARVRLQKDNPFFSYLAMSLKLKEADIQTCAVDTQGNFLYNPTFVNLFDKESIKTIVAHEVLHVAFLHLIRWNGRDRDLWNIACDTIVNNILDNNDFNFNQLKKFEMEGRECKSIVPYRNKIKLFNQLITDLDKKFVEEIYDEISKFAKQNKKKDDGEGEYGNDENQLSKKQGYKGFDEHKFVEKNGHNKAEIEKAEGEWKKRLTEAITYAKMIGKEPAGMGRYVDALLDNKLNWREILHRFITNGIPIDFTYSKPSKKSISTGFYMPDVKREILDVSVAVDTSGSIGGEELQEFLSEIVGIAKSFENVRINLMFWDTEMNNHYVVDNGNIADILSLEIKGGGGTNFSGVNDWVRENIPNNKLLIFFTDGYANFDEESEFETLWVLSKNSCPEKDIPYGSIVKM